MKNSTINFIERLISSEEFMAETINTEHEDFEGSSEQIAFVLHQSNIVMLEKIKSIVEQSQQLKQRELELMEKLDRYENGYQGACYACEAVGEKILELMAVVERLKQAGEGLRRELLQWSLTERDPETTDALRQYEDARNEGPQQSLAEHDAEVVIDFGDSIESIADRAYQEGIIQSATAVYDVKCLAAWYANRLRQQPRAEHYFTGMAESVEVTSSSRHNADKE